MAPETDPVKSELLAWHERFAACVRGRDFAGGSALFAPECQGFGTFVEHAVGRDCLMWNQWRPVWSATRAFHFLPESFECIVSLDRSLACVLALWESFGTGPDEVEFRRRGRCTTLLRRAKEHPAGWIALHTHYSKTPMGEI